MGIDAIASDPASTEQVVDSPRVEASKVTRLDTGSPHNTNKKTVLLLDRRKLDRDCLARSLEANDPYLNVVAFASIEEWNDASCREIPAAVVYVFGSIAPSNDKNYEQICSITQKVKGAPLVVIADTDDIGEMLKALEHGARGFIPSSVGVGVAVEAIRLAHAGGVFLPASGILAVRNFIEKAIKDTRGPQKLFTPREAEVAEELRRGKANKIIAYELDLRESTVKVHVRSIMKKLNATNRTEVAYKLNELK